MFKLILVVLLALVLPSLAANWAVLTAGSNNFYNYRHQSDVFHTYQVLLKRGFLPENIIVLAYDDIATSTSNPFYGKVFNKPTYREPGIDVYEGVKIDYLGKDVTPDVFLNVLLGNETYTASRGTGRVLKQKAADNIFVFFSDHGSPGSISFPSQLLYADQLVTTLKKMAGTFNKLVFYLETCESGSMFINLPSDIGIYALSAASPYESSWATYCSPDDVIAGKHIGTCLGDLFSVSFIEDLEENDDILDTLQAQFERVKQATTDSKVMQWGDLSISNGTINSIFGSRKRSNGWFDFEWVNGMKNLMTEKSKPIFQKISTYHVKINYLLNLYKTHKSSENFQKLSSEMSHMKKMDTVFANLKYKMRLSGKYDAANIDFTCYRRSVDLFEAQCAKFEDYNLQYLKYLVENCEKNGYESIQPTIAEYCK